MFLWTKRVDGTLKELTMIRKKAKNTFKNKALQDPFLKTVKLHCSALDSYIEFKMKLDSALEAHNLIALEVVTELGVNKDINLNQQAICHCLNGQQLVSIGTITLRWKGKDFRKIFQTTFHVIDSHKHQVLPWQIILGAETIHEHGILKFAGFGGRAILPKEEKDDKAKREARKEEHEKEVAENKAKKAAHKTAKEEASRQAESSSVPSESGSRHS